MKISKIFHFLYFSVLSIPLLSIPIFAIYSMNHEISGNSINTSGYEVQNKYETNIVSVLNNYADLINGNIYKVTIDEPLFDFLDINGGMYASYCYYNDSNYYTDIELINVDNYIYLANDNNTLQITNDDDAPYITVVSDYIYLVCNNWTTYTQNLSSEGAQITKSDYTPKEYVYNDGIVLDDEDIVSQFIYSEYNFMDKYLPMYKFAPFNGIYSWISNTFFTGNVPIVFTIFYQWFAYWLFVSLCWLIFDVLMYVPLVVHRWLDKGALE